MNSKVTAFIEKSKIWQKEMAKLRSILLKTEIEEEFKWNLPCYTYKGKNIAIIQPFKLCLGFMFFKGSLLKDPKKVLSQVGANSRVARRFEFHSVQEITKLATTIRNYIKEAIEVEASGKKIVKENKPMSLPAELKKVFTKKPNVKKAFNSLTPGRQRAYILFISSAKQTETRMARIEKYIPRMLKGKGPNDP